jgi:biotin transport system substrate-specific component
MRLVRELLVLLLGTVFLALLARIEIRLEPFSPVPITGQTLGVLLIGALYGPWRGALCLLAYLGEGAAGLPVFAGGASGAAVLVGPTGGYLIAFPVAAAIVGLLVQPLRGVLSGWRALPGLLIGTIVIYLIGVPGLALSTGMGLLTAIEKGMLPFIPGDLIKVVVAAAVLPSGMTALRSLGWPLRGPAGDADGTT